MFASRPSLESNIIYLRFYIYSDTADAFRVSGILHMERGELCYQNNEDARRKFENYPLMESNPGVILAILEPYINRNI